MTLFPRRMPMRFPPVLAPLLAMVGAVVGARAALAQPAPSPASVGVYVPITPGERVAWAAYSAAGPPNLMGGFFSAGWGTWMNRPEEYGPSYEGFVKRYGMRLTGSATSAAMEAELGMLWGEDPRYLPAAGRQRWTGRVGHVIKYAFLARDRRGQPMPAYARYAAITGSNFLSNTWRADSEATVEDAAIRTGLGFLGRIASNTFREFWPDLRSVFRGRN